MSKEHAQFEHHIISSNKINNNSQEVAESLIEIKMIWEKFFETFQNEADQNSEIEKRLVGLPFSSKQKFARDMAVMKWWDGQNLTTIKTPQEIGAVL